jgi:glycosyltransferase involved in cell wall biosynthesis
VTEEIKSKAKELRKDEKVSSDAWVWIFVGRIVKDKGIAELLEAFVQVHSSYPQDRLWLLGDEEPDLDPLDAPHKEILQNHPAIRSWGFQKDIRPYLAASQVLVFPSYREGFPNVPLQAGLMGCMLILSDINGCNEIIQNEKEGILVPVKNRLALEAAMRNVRKDIALRNQYADLIQHKIKTDYNQKELWKIILHEYNERLAKLNSH